MAALDDDLVSVARGVDDFAVPAAVPGDLCFDLVHGNLRTGAEQVVAQGSPPYLREPRHRDDVIGGTPMSGRPRRCLVSTLEKQT
jgi:hypothetical protein